MRPTSPERQRDLDRHCSGGQRRAGGIAHVGGYGGEPGVRLEGYCTQPLLRRYHLDRVSMTRAWDGVIARWGEDGTAQVCECVLIANAILLPISGVCVWGGGGMCEDGCELTQTAIGKCSGEGLGRLATTDRLACCHIHFRPDRRPSLLVQHTTQHNQPRFGLTLVCCFFISFAHL